MITSSSSCWANEWFWSIVLVWSHPCVFLAEFIVVVALNWNWIVVISWWSVLWWFGIWGLVFANVLLSLFTILVVFVVVTAAVWAWVRGTAQVCVWSDWGFWSGLGGFVGSIVWLWGLWGWTSWIGSFVLRGWVLSGVLDDLIVSGGNFALFWSDNKFVIDLEWYHNKDEC